MTAHKPTIGYIIRFGLLTGFGSFGILALYSLSNYYFFYEFAGRSMITMLIAGVIVHFKLDGGQFFSRNKSRKDVLNYKQMGVVYFAIYIISITVNFIENHYILTAIVISPLIGTLAGFILTIRFLKEANSYTTNTTTTFPSIEKKKIEKNNNSYRSVIPTGDDLEYPLYVSHGSAHWISDSKKESLTDKINGAPSYRGLWLGGGFFHHEKINILSIAPPGTGKGGALIIPNLLWKREYKHSFVVFDPKGTNACITARFQKEQGNKVIIIDPMNLQKASNATHGISSASFNPLDHIKNDIFNGASQIANLLIPDDPRGEKFWNQDARNLVQAVIMHIMTDKEYLESRNLITFFKLMLTGDFYELLGLMGANPALNGSIIDFAYSFKNMIELTPSTFTSVRSVANSSIKWLSNPALQQYMTKSDFNPDDLENGGISLYLCQPIQNKEGFATFSRLIIGFCLRANSKPISRPKAWVYYLLDEFPTMGIFPEVVECLAYSREYKMRIWIFAQSMSQLDNIYGTDARNQMLGNIRILQAFGTTDYATKQYISMTIGNTTILHTTKSTARETNTSRSDTYSTNSGNNATSGQSSSVTSQEAYNAAPLLAPENVQYDPNILTLTDWGPMRLSRWQYWQKTPEIAGRYVGIFFDGRADKNPNFG